VDQHSAAVAGRLKQKLPGFEGAYFRAIPGLAADRQAALVDAWLKERKPAFAGFEEAWLKAFPGLAAATRVALLVARPTERNPAFDGALMPKVEGGVLTSLDMPAPSVQDYLPLRALSGLKTLVCRSTAGWDNKAESDAAVLRALQKLESINGKPVAQFWKEV